MLFSNPGRDPITSIKLFGHFNEKLEKDQCRFKIYNRHKATQDQKQKQRRIHIVKPESDIVKPASDIGGVTKINELAI